MIRQQELREVETAQTVVDELAKSPAIASYVAAQKRLETALSRLRDRADEEVEPGKYALIVKRSVTVSYEKFWGCIAGLKPIAAVLARTNEAQALVQRLIDRDPAAAFISPRIAVQVVRTKTERPAPAPTASGE